MVWYYSSVVAIVVFYLYSFYLLYMENSINILISLKKPIR